MGRSQTASVAAIHEHEIRKYRQNAKEKGADSLFSIMPYTGQNILHISIIHRNSEQVRWILDFFRSREHAIPGAPVKLLVQRTIGRFFRKEGDFYCARRREGNRQIPQGRCRWRRGAGGHGLCGRLVGGRRGARLRRWR